MRMTTKGQVTVPKHVRKAMGLKPGSEIGFEEEDGEFKLVNLDHINRDAPGEELVRHIVQTAAKLRAEGQINDLTTERIMEMTRGMTDDVDSR